MPCKEMGNPAALYVESHMAAVGERPEKGYYCSFPNSLLYRQVHRNFCAVKTAEI